MVDAVRERGGVDVNEFEGVDLAGISRKFPEEKRTQLAARIDASAEEVAGAWAALLLAQTGMRYAEWANTTQRVEQTKQNTLRIVKAVVDYLTTASQAKLRRTISYIVAKRRRQGFGHEEVITSMLLLRRSFEKGCGPINGEAGLPHRRGDARHGGRGGHLPSRHQSSGGVRRRRYA